jgi:hypothetical protein
MDSTLRASYFRMVCPMPSTLPVSTSDILLRFTNFHSGTGFSRSLFHAESSRQKDRIAIAKRFDAPFQSIRSFQGVFFRNLDTWDCVLPSERSFHWSGASDDNRLLIAARS